MASQPRMKYLKILNPAIVSDTYFKSGILVVLWTLNILQGYAK